MKLNTNCGNQNIIINLKTYLFCVCAAFLILAFLIQHFCQRLCDIPGWFDGENSHFKVQLTGNIKVLLWGGRGARYSPTPTLCTLVSALC